MTSDQWFWAILGVAFLVCMAVIGIHRNWFYKPRRVREREKVEETRSQRELQKAVEAGERNADGEPLCATCNDGKTVATEYGYRTIQTEGLWAWVCITFFGAPSRFRIVRDIYSEAKYCRDCRPIVERKNAEKALQIASEEQEASEKYAVLLRRYVRTGCDEEIRAQLESYEKEAQRQAKRAPAPVVPIRTAGQ